MNNVFIAIALLATLGSAHAAQVDDSFNWPLGFTTEQVHVETVDGYNWPEGYEIVAENEQQVDLQGFNWPTGY